MFRNLAVIVFFIFVLASCDQNVVMERNIDLKNRKWELNEVLAFDFDVDDVTEKYNFYYNVRNTIEYPYRNLYVTYYLEDTIGNLISTDLHNMDLFDKKTGAPKGRSGLGDIYEHQFLALPEYQFDSVGTYRFRIQQFMRQQELPEIVSIGLRVEVAEK